MLPDVRTGAVVAGFRVQSLLGEGAMGTVYLAEETAGGRRVALKLLTPELARDERFRRRFVRETELAASLDHPHVVPTLASGEDDGALYLAMAYVEGSDLRKLLRREGRLEPERALDLIEQVAAALDAAHAAGLVHRDVKPGNILVTSGEDGEQAYICDFGLARHVSSVSSLTSERGFVGTIDYVPPEQIEGGTIDGRADVYSLGCVLYECVAGARPFDRESELSVLFAHLNDPPPRVTELRPELPPAFDTVFERALAKSREQRYSTCDELARAARAALAGKTLVPRPVRRRRALAGAAALVVASAVVLVAFVLLGWNGSATLARVQPDAIGIVDAKSGGISSQVRLPSAPSAVAAGGGSLWIASEAAGTVTHFDPQSNGLQTVTVPGRPGGIAYGAGSLWVTDRGGRAVVQINPRTYAVVQKITVGNGPGAVAVGKGAVWVANTVDGTVSRFDLGRGAVTNTIAVGRDPVGIAVGRDGIWVAGEGTDSVLRLDPVSRAIVRAIEVGHAPTGIAVGAGSIWATNSEDGTVSRIDPTSNSVTATVHVGGNPSTIAAARDAVWIANSRENTIERIDPKRNKAARTVTLGSRPSAVVLDGRNLYATTGVPLAGHRGGVLRVESEPSACRCADPAFALGPNITDFDVPGLIYDGLVAYRRVGGSTGDALVPDLAARLPTSRDGGKTWSAQLRTGIRYSNGTQVRAADFRAGVERSLALDPMSAFGGIVGAAGCLARPSRPCQLSRGIKTDGATGTITIRLTRPDIDFVYKLALPEASLVPARKAPRMARSDAIPGTGPYQLAVFEPSREIRLLRNKHFHVWSPDARPDGYPDEIRFQLRGDATAKLRAVETRAADWVSLLDPSLTAGEQRGVLTRYADTLHNDPRAWTLWGILNTRAPPFNDVRVRRAMNYAIDRRRVVDLTGGGAQTSCQILPPNFPGYRAYCPYTRGPNPAGTWTAPNLQKARKLVRASGTEGMRVEVESTADHVVLAEDRYFVSVLRELGYRASLRIVSVRQNVPHIADSRKRTQMGNTGWVADTLAPTNFLQLFTCASFVPRSAANLNLSEYCNARLDTRIKKVAALEVADPARADELAAAVDQALVDEAVVLPYANPPNRVLVSRRVGNYQSHPLWGTLLDQLWVR